MRGVAGEIRHEVAERGLGRPNRRTIAVEQDVGRREVSVEHLGGAGELIDVTCGADDGA